MGQSSFDYYDFQFDSNLDFGETVGGPRQGSKSNSRKTAEEFAQSAFESGKSSLADSRRWAEAVKKGLPEPFRETWDAADKGAESLSSLYDHAQKEIVDPVRKLTQAVDKLVPDNTPIIKAITKTMSDFFSKTEKKSGQGSLSAQHVEDEGIKLLLAETFAKSEELSSVREETRDERETAREATREEISRKRFETEIGVFSRMDNNLQTLSVMSQKVTLPFQKKGLEIQARSLFTLNKLLKEAQDARLENRAFLQSIQRNTGLPDAQKIRASEEFKDQLRRRTVGSIQDKMFGEGSIFDRMRTQMTKDAKSFMEQVGGSLQMALMGADSAQMMREMMADMSKAEAAGFFAGDMAGNWIRKKTVGKVTDRLKKNEGFMKAGYKAAAGVRNPEELMDMLKDTEFMRNRRQDGKDGVFEKMFDYIRGTMGPGSGDTNLQGGLKGANDPASMTRYMGVVQTKVVPGYLARILREITALRTGEDNVPMLSYDPVSGAFNTSANIRDKMRKRLGQETMESSLTTSVDRLSRMLKGSLGLEGDDKDFRQAGLGVTSYKGSWANGAFRESSSYKKASEKDKAVWDKISEKMNDTGLEGSKFKYEFYKGRDDVRGSWGSMGASIQKMIDAGQEDELLELGLIKRAGDGSLSLDHEAIKEFQTRVMGDPRYATSDINMKTGIVSQPKSGFLSRLKNINVSEWFYKGDRKAEGKKVGPMAQDVNREFGEEAAPGGKKIDLVSMNGILMSAVKELSDRFDKLRQTFSDKEKSSEAKPSNTSATSTAATAAAPLKDRRPRYNAKTSTNRHLFNIHRELFDLRKMIESKSGFGFGGGSMKMPDWFSNMEMPDVKDLKNKAGEKFKPVVETGNAFLDSLQIAVSAGLSQAGSFGNRIFQEGRSLYNRASEFAKDTYANNKDGAKEGLDAFGKSAFGMGQRALRSGLNFVNDTLPRWADQAQTAGVNAIQGLKNLGVTALNAPRDVFVRGDMSPVMTAARMRAGHYRDALTGKVIRNIEDLINCVNDIVDAGMNNETVLRRADAAKGLFDSSGRELTNIATMSKNILFGAAGFVGAKVAQGINALKGSGDFFSKAKDNITGAFASLGDRFKDAKGSLGLFDKRTLGLLAQIRDLVAWAKPKKILAHVYNRKPIEDDSYVQGSGYYSMITGDKGSGGGGGGSDSGPSGPSDPSSPSAGPSFMGGGSGNGWDLGGLASKAKDAFMASKAGGWLKNRMGGNTQTPQPEQQAPSGNQLALPGPSQRGGALATIPRGDVTDVAPKGEKQGFFRRNLGRLSNSRLGRFAGGKAGMIASGLGTLGSLAATAGKGLAGVFGSTEATETQAPVFSNSAFANNLNAMGRRVIGMGQGKIGMATAFDRDGSGERDNGLSDQLQIREDQAAAQKRLVAERAEQARKEAQETAFRFKTENVIDKMMKQTGALLSSISGGASGMFETLGTAISAIPGLGAIWKGIKGIGSFGGKAVMGLGRGAAALGGAAASKIGMLYRAGAGVGLMGKVRGIASVVSGVGRGAQIVGLASGNVAGLAAAAGGTALRVLGTMIASPLLLKAAAVAAVGYGLYKAYKYFTRNSLSDLEKVRALQYGFDKDSKDLHRLMELEGYLLDGKVMNTPGNISINYSQVKMDELYEMFDIESKDAEMQDRFRQWFRYRFEPFFIRHVSALKAADKTKKLSDAGDLEPEKYEAYLKSAMFLDGPYDAGENPLSRNENLANTQSDVEKVCKGLIDKKKLEKPKGNKLGLAHPLLRATALTTQSLEIKRENEKQKADADAQKRMNEAGARLSNSGKSLNISKPGSVSMQEALRSDDAGNAPPQGGTFASDFKPGGGSTSGNVNRASGPLGDKSKGLPFIQLKQGVNFDGLNGNFKDILLAMASDYGNLTGKKIPLTDGYRSYEDQARIYAAMPNVAAKPGNSIHEKGFAVDIPSQVANELDKLGLLRKYGLTRPIGGEAWHVEPAGIQLDIDRARKDPQWASQQILASIGRGGGGYGTVSGARMKGRDPALAKTLFESASETLVDNAPKPEAGTDKALQPIIDTGVKQPTALGSNTRGAPESVAGVFNRTGIQAANDSFRKVAAPMVPSSVNTPKPVALPSVQRGEDAANEPSVGSSSGESGSVKDQIGKFAQQAQMDPKVMQLFAAAESSMGKNTKPHVGSARGPFQFMPATWNETINKYGPKYQLPPSSQPEDLKASTLMASEYLKNNSGALKSQIPNPDLIDMYSTHLLGPGGAKNFARLDDTAIPANHMLKAAASNPNIFYADGAKRQMPLTKKQMRENLEDKFKKLSSAYGVPMPSLRNGSEKDTEAQKADGIMTADYKPETPALPQAQPGSGSLDPKPNAFQGSGGLRSVAESVNQMTSTAPRPQESVKANDAKASGMDEILSKMATSSTTLVEITQNSVVPLLQGMHDTLKAMFEQGTGGKASEAPASPASPSAPSAPKRPMSPKELTASKSVVERGRNFGT